MAAFSDKETTMELDWWLVLLMGLVAVLCWYRFAMKTAELKKKKKKTAEGEVSGTCRIPAGNTGWPFIGETLNFLAAGYSSTPVSFMDKRKSLFGNVFKTHLLGTPVIVSTDSEVNKAILHNHGNAFVPAYPKSLQELLGDNSVTQMNGAPHRRAHSLVGRFLRSPQLKSLILRDIENSVRMRLASWGERSEPVLFQEEIEKMTFEVLIKALLSIGPGEEEFDYMRRESEEYAKGLICLPIKLPGTRLYKSLKAKQRLLKVADRIIEERKISAEKSGGCGGTNDLLDVLLQYTGEPSEGGGFSSDFIRENIIEIILPGEETVPAAITLAVKFLTDSPAVLKHLTDENMELKRRKTESSEEYTWMDYMSLSFTQHVINETLRLGNIASTLWRKTTKDVEIKGHLLPKGWCVLASLISVHMDEENYENPCEFNPWRWEKIGAAVNNINFAPFGAGQRMCTGMELSKLEISVFLHHFVTTYSWLAEAAEVVYFPLVKTKLRIRVTPVTTAI